MITILILGLIALFNSTKPNTLIMILLSYIGGILLDMNIV